MGGATPGVHSSGHRQSVREGAQRLLRQHTNWLEAFTKPFFYSLFGSWVLLKVLWIIDLIPNCGAIRRWGLRKEARSLGHTLQGMEMRAYAMPSVSS